MPACFCICYKSIPPHALYRHKKNGFPKSFVLFRSKILSHRLTLSGHDHPSHVPVVSLFSMERNTVIDSVSLSFRAGGARAIATSIRV